MKFIFPLIITLISFQAAAFPKDSIQMVMNSNMKKTGFQLLKKQKVSENSVFNNTRFESFNISADWLLETKAELINGISYSPTLEFNLNRPNGINFQLQTGALPILDGLKIRKTQPAAGLSFSYKF